MNAIIGKRSRRLRLCARGAVNLLALDHGLSLGWTESQDTPVTIAQDCDRLGLSGTVCHVGLLERLRGLGTFETFLQMYGSTPGDRRKEIVASVSDAIRADCVGIAVEYLSSGGSAALSRAASLLREAHDYGLLVLVMANYEGEDFRAMGVAVVGASQLGADYIKVRLPAKEPSAIERARLGEIIRDSPPTLVAGGASSTDLGSTLRVASGLGMVGSCIGRHYFDTCNREPAVRLATATFILE